ncbi:MAG: hypothetical protein AAGM36_00670 [Cyanobacteria bacterium J06597_1]
MSRRNWVNNLFINPIQDPEPIEIGSEVCFVGQIIGLVSDDLTAMAANLHDTSE